MFEMLFEYLSFPFVQYALIAGTLIALCSSLLGVTLVLRRFSYIGDGLSHVAFGAMSFAAVFALTNKMTLILPATIVCAVLLLCGGQKRKIKGDAAIAMISVGSLAVGYLLMNIFAPSSNLSGDVCSTLFGSTSILTLTKGEVLASVVLSVVVVVIFVLCYNKLFAVTFDETFARAIGVKTDFYNLLLAVVIAVIIVLAMNLVGSLLISALVIFPAMSAMRLSKSFKHVTVYSAIISVVCALVGMLISILAGTPVGATIVAVDMLVFVVCALVGRK
ncbi:MAG: metal ABC transporter permease [Treponema sp.]|nr:metal ABC transporter permease [Treponema sp.]